MSTTKTLGLCRVSMHYKLGQTHIATDSEARLGIQAKLLEECGEVVKAPEDIYEYADVLQVLMDMAALNNIGWDLVIEAQKTKHQKRGGFLNDNGQALVWRREERYG